MIFTEIIKNLCLNKKGDLCWVSKDTPLMIQLKDFVRLEDCRECSSEPQVE